MAFFAFALEFEDGDEAGAGGDEDAFFFVAVDDLSGFGVFGNGVFLQGGCAPDDDALAVEAGEGGGPATVAADEVVDVGGGALPVDGAVAFAEDLCAGGGVVVLGLGFDVVELHQGADEELGADGGEFEVQGVCGFVGVYGDAVLKEDGAGVEAFVHDHGGDAGFGFAVDDGALDGACAAIQGEQ